MLELNQTGDEYLYTDLESAICLYKKWILACEEKYGKGDFRFVDKMTDWSGDMINCEGERCNYGAEIGQHGSTRTLLSRPILLFASRIRGRASLVD